MTLAGDFVPRRVRWVGLPAKAADFLDAVASERKRLEDDAEDTKEKVRAAEHGGDGQGMKHPHNVPTTGTRGQPGQVLTTFPRALRRRAMAALWAFS